MIALDTNVLVRHLVKDDDPAQTARVAADVAAALDEGHEVLVPLVVLVETVWVLRTTLRVPRRQVVALVEALLDMSGVRLAEADMVRSAVARYRAGGADFSDYLIEAEARRNGATSILTFDQRFARGSNMARLLR